MIYITLLLISALASTPIHAMDEDDHTYSTEKADRTEQYKLKKFYHARDYEKHLARKHLNNAEYRQHQTKNSNANQSNPPYKIQISNDTGFQNNTPQTNLTKLPIYKTKNACNPHELTMDTLYKVLLVNPNITRSPLWFLIPHNSDVDVVCKKWHQLSWTGCFVKKSKLISGLLPSKQIVSYYNERQRKKTDTIHKTCMLSNNKPAQTNHQLALLSVCADKVSVINTFAHRFAVVEMIRNRASAS